MFPSETLSRIVHADRVRNLERAAEANRLLAAAADTPPEVPADGHARSHRSVAPAPCPPATRGGSAGVVA